MATSTKKEQKQEKQSGANEASVKVISVNRQAYHDYFVELTVEAVI